MNSELIWIDDRCYRVNDSNVDVTMFEEHDLYEEETNFNDEANDEGEYDNFNVESNEDGKYTTKFHVSKYFMGPVIGRKGAIIERIRYETKTEIKIPKQNQSGDIAISGATASNVKAARRRINMIVMSARMKERATHFLSIPMINEEIVNNFNEFKANVIQESPNLDESLFIKPTKLHVTIGVMCLMDNEERTAATKLLNEANDKIILPIIQPHLPIKLRLKGLSYMNDDPHQVHVLYGCVQAEGAPPDLLQKLSDALVDHFYKAGFMDKGENDQVKLHVTLINSKYRKHSQNGDKESGDNTPRKRRVRESFDASTVLEKFADFDFGVIELSSVHLSQRHAMGPDGYYQPTCVVSCKQ